MFSDTRTKFWLFSFKIAQSFRKFRYSQNGYKCMYLVLPCGLHTWFEIGPYVGCTNPFYMEISSSCPDQDTSVVSISWHSSIACCTTCLFWQTVNIVCVKSICSVFKLPWISICMLQRGCAHAQDINTRVGCWCPVSVVGWPDLYIVHTQICTH